MKICLVCCPSPFLIDEKVFPPLGLMAVGAGLKQQGHEVVLYDGDLDSLPLDYMHYGLGPTTPEYHYAKQILHKLKDVNPEINVILGGPHATLQPGSCLQDDWNCVVVGDGEFAAEKALLCQVLCQDRLIIAENLPLDDYPEPDRSLVNLLDYRFLLDGIPATTIMTSRGCPFHCAYCCKTDRRVRMRSVEKVITEIDTCVRLGFEAVTFPEDIFILNRRRTAAICEHLKKRGLIWRCLIRADLLVRYGNDFVRMLADSGCVGVGMGVESGSDVILHNVHKSETTSDIKAAVAMLKAHGVSIKGFFILGLPGENEATLAETDKLLAEIQLDDVDIKIFHPYFGSPIYEHPEQYDVHWEDVPLKDSFYKGRPGEYHGSVSTSALTTERIVEAWIHLENKYKDWSLTPSR